MLEQIISSTHPYLFGWILDIIEHPLRKKRHTTMSPSTRRTQLNASFWGILSDVRQPIHDITIEPPIMPLFLSTIILSSSSFTCSIFIAPEIYSLRILGGPKTGSGSDGSWFSASYPSSRLLCLAVCMGCTFFSIPCLNFTPAPPTSAMLLALNWGFKWKR